jgi:S-adenosylmethionine:tRNA ribosyltransferase-isomerase
MRIDLFDYALPDELIAAEPPEKRDGGRLLGVGLSPALRDGTIQELADQIAPGSVVVVNDTRVLAARLLGVKASGGKAEVFLLECEATHPDGSEVWRALGRASKGLKVGMTITCGTPETGVLTAKILEFTAERAIFRVKLTARTAAGEATVVAPLRRALGHMPLPPYIKREARPSDAVRYQTVFAREEGAVAAPTAGLHLTEEILKQIREKATVVPVTLHVGLGTFAPVTAEDLDDHAMHEERFRIPAATVTALAAAKREGRPIVAIGTTVVRALEGATAAGLDLANGKGEADFEGRTRILIQPGYRFQVVDRLLTNFHLPKSTLLALVAAFAGRDRILAAYAHAVAHRYRFFSYGDAMLLDRSDA